MTRPAVIHFYRIEKDKTDEQVDASFEQNFMHVHLDDCTILIRRMFFEGDKLDPNGPEMLRFLEIANNDPVIKDAVQRFLNQEE